MNYRTLIQTNELTHDEWLEIRRSGIGGSDAAAIAGLNPWKSAIGVWLDKTGQDTEKFDNERMRIGRDLEDYVADRFEEATGLKVRRKNAVLQHPELDWMIANIDRFIVGVDEGLECKVTNSFAATDWKDEKIPVHYETQVHHYMAVTGASAWWIAALIGNEKVVIKRVPRDEDVIESLIKIESAFWNDFVIPKVMPAPDGSEAAKEDILKVWPESDIEVEIELDAKFDKLLQRRAELKELIDQAEVEVDQINQSIQIEMKVAEAAKTPMHSITWKSRSKTGVDSEKLKIYEPAVYNRFLKTSHFRVFSVRRNKDGR